MYTTRKYCIIGYTPYVLYTRRGSTVRTKYGGTICSTPCLHILHTACVYIRICSSTGVRYILYTATVNNGVKSRTILHYNLFSAIVDNRTIRFTTLVHRLNTIAVNRNINGFSVTVNFLIRIFFSISYRSTLYMTGNILCSTACDGYIRNVSTFFHYLHPVRRDDVICC